MSKDLISEISISIEGAPTNKAKRHSINDPKPRRELGALAMWNFNIMRYKAYSEQAKSLPALYKDIIVREMNDLAQHAMKENHVLRLFHTKHDNLYFEKVARSAGVQEHTIPSSQWLALLAQTSDVRIREGILFAGWCAPVCRVSKDLDKAIRENKEAKKNLTPRTPFRRYQRASDRLDYQTDVVEFQTNCSIMDWSLADHYNRLRQIAYFEEIFAEVDKVVDFDEVVEMVSSFDVTDSKNAVALEHLYSTSSSELAK